MLETRLDPISIAHLSLCIIFSYFHIPPMAIGTCLFIFHSALHKFQVHLKFISRFDVCFIAFRSSSSSALHFLCWCYCGYRCCSWLWLWLKNWSLIDKCGSNCCLGPDCTSNSWTVEQLSIPGAGTWEHILVSADHLPKLFSLATPRHSNMMEMCFHFLSRAESNKQFLTFFYWT